MHSACWPMVVSTREQMGEAGLVDVPLCCKLGGTPTRLCCGVSQQGVETSEPGCVSTVPLCNAPGTTSTLLTNCMEAA